MRDDLRDGLERIFAEVQVAEFRKSPQRRRERCQTVVVQIEKVGEAVEVAQSVRQARKVVVTEVEHA